MVQALYAHRVGGDPLPEAVQAQVERRRPHAESLDYVHVLQGILAGRLGELDARIDAAVEGRAPERVGAVERAILQLALAELLHCEDVPAPVVLDEAVELTRTFSTEASTGFVLGVLDRLVRAARAGEEND